MDTLRNHVEMIDLNPLVIERTTCKPPGFATPEEYHAIWYEITDRISYFPGAKGKVTYHGCFNDLTDGLQTHVYAPLGLDIRSRWVLAGNLPHEPAAPVELGLGIPRQGLYLREDVQMRCNIMMTSFVKKTLKKAHSTLVDRLVEKAKIRQVDISNTHLSEGYRQSYNASLATSPHLRRLSGCSSDYQGTSGTSPNLSVADPIIYRSTSADPEASDRAHPYGHHPPPPVPLKDDGYRPVEAASSDVPRPAVPVVELPG